MWIVLEQIGHARSIRTLVEAFGSLGKALGTAERLEGAVPPLRHLRDRYIKESTALSTSAAISTRLTASHPNSEVKLVRAGVVLRWGTTREGPVLRFFFCFVQAFFLLRKIGYFCILPGLSSLS